MKKRIGEWLIKLGSQWSGRKLYSVPVREPSRDIAELDFKKCQCGHAMYDHIPDLDGHGTICLCCYATMRHRPEYSDLLEAELITFET